MSPTFYDNALAVGYLLAWVAVFVVVHWRRRWLDALSVVVGSYILYAVISILSLNDDLFNMMFEPLKLFPYIFLFVMLMMALAPSVYIHFAPPDEIRPTNSRIIKPMLWMVVVCGVALIPGIVANFGDGVMKLFTDVDAGKDAYSETIENSGDAGSKISNMFSIVFNAMYDIAIFFFFYLLTLKKKPLFLIMGLLAVIFIGVLQPVMMGQRTGVINGIFTVVVAFFMFRRYISRVLTRVIELAGLACMAVVALPVVAITFSRFGETNAGVIGFLNWYIGQGSIYFNNYGMDAGGIRYGDRTLNLLKRLVDPSTPANYVERRMKYHNLEIDDYYFTTYVGDFCLDFGPVIAFLIFLVFNAYVLRSIRPQNGVIRLDQMLLLYFTLCVCMQGGMYLFAYSDTGNLKMFALFGLVFYLQLHEALLRKFPRQPNKHISRQRQ